VARGGGMGGAGGGGGEGRGWGGGGGGTRGGADQKKIKNYPEKIPRHPRAHVSSLHRRHVSFFTSMLFSIIFRGVLRGSVFSSVVGGVLTGSSGRRSLRNLFLPSSSDCPDMCLAIIRDVRSVLRAHRQVLRSRNVQAASAGTNDATRGRGSLTDRFLPYFRP